jgi:hypothetical protein
MSGKGWIGIDLDGTLAVYKHDSDINTIGEPIPSMLRRVNEWLKAGYEVRIFTARVAACHNANSDGVVDSAEFAEEQRKLIDAWTKKHIGWALRVTATKDFEMVQLWDDRCVQVITNTGLAIEVST